MKKEKGIKFIFDISNNVDDIEGSTQLFYKIQLFKSSNIKNFKFYEYIFRITFYNILICYFNLYFYFLSNIIIKYFF